MKVRYFQKGFNYSQDGYGNRLVVHLQGCNLHCPWCSNPEGIACCGGTETEVAEMNEFILSCKRLFTQGGGVTFTGGECTLQYSALKEMLEFCKSNGINTAIETNGTFFMPKDFYPLLDLIICDFKHYDRKKMAETVGCKVDYKNNIKKYLEYGKEIWVRTVLINGFNAAKSDAEKFAGFFAELPTDNAYFEFLPYHEYGKPKWIKLNKPYTVTDGFIDEKIKEYFERTYVKRNLKIIRS